MKPFNLFLLVLCICGGLFVAYRTYKPAPEPPIETVNVVRQSLQSGIKVPGNVAPLTRIQVFPPVSGRIEALFVQEGDRVKEGQLLAEMSSVERATILDIAKSEGPEKVAYWKNVYKPIKIYAPHSGQVIVLNTTVAQITANTNPILTISDKLMVKAQVDETDMAKVRPGMHVSIRLDTYPDEEIVGKVARLSYESTVMNNVSVYTVDIEIKHPPAFLRSGMTVSAWITTNAKQQVLVLPEKAIRYREKAPYVLVQKNKGFESQAVTLGIQHNGVVEIVSGVSENDTIGIVPQQPQAPDTGYTPFRPKSKKE